MIKGLLSLIGLFVGAGVLLFALIYLLHRLWILIKRDRDVVDWKDSLQITMVIFTIVAASLALIIMFIL